MAASKPSRSEPSWITSWPMLVFLTAYSSCARNLRLRDSGLFYSSLLRRIRLQIFYRNRDGTNRRRTQRVMLKFPVRVSGQNAVGSQFEEETHTLAVNENGALVLLSVSARKGQLLKLNTATGGNADCVVAYLGQRKGDLWEVGVAFSLPNPKFWQVAFPPSDWTPPAPEEF